MRTSWTYRLNVLLLILQEALMQITSFLKRMFKGKYETTSLEI